jgi:ribosome-associated translation inhibitor RaiA
MQVLVNTDHKLEGGEALARWVTSVVEETLGHLRNHVTRVEVHLSLEAGTKDAPGDTRCLVEARLEGQAPIAVTQQDRLLDNAVNGAVRKLKRSVEHASTRAEMPAHMRA